MEWRIGFLRGTRYYNDMDLQVMNYVKSILSNKRSLPRLLAFIPSASRETFQALRLFLPLSASTPSYIYDCQPTEKHFPVSIILWEEWSIGRHYPVPLKLRQTGTTLPCLRENQPKSSCAGYPWSFSLPHWLPSDPPRFLAPLVPSITV